MGDPIRGLLDALDDNGELCEMTDEELIARLRELGDHASFEPHMHHKAADRIEDLVERNKELALQLLATQGQAADRIEALIAERDAAEAKLAKAVEALENVHRFGVITHPALATLAEIKSGVATTPYGLEGESHE